MAAQLSPAHGPCAARCIRSAVQAAHGVRCCAKAQQICGPGLVQPTSQSTRIWCAASCQSCLLAGRQQRSGNLRTSVCMAQHCIGSGARRCADVMMQPHCLLAAAHLSRRARAAMAGCSGGALGNPAGSFEARVLLQALVAVWHPGSSGPELCTRHVTFQGANSDGGGGVCWGQVVENFGVERLSQHMLLGSQCGLLVPCLGFGLHHACSSYVRGILPTIFVSAVVD